MADIEALVRLTHRSPEELLAPTQVRMVRNQQTYRWGDAWMADGEFREIDSAFEPPIERILLRYVLLIQEGIGTLLAHERDGEWVPVWHIETNARKLVSEL